MAGTPPTREQVFQALLSLVQQIQLFKTVQRQNLLAGNISAFQQPALFQVEEEEETAIAGRGAFPIRRWHAWLVIYAAHGQDVAGATVIDPLIDAVVAALAPSTGPDLAVNAQTLGGLVAYCAIKGKARKESGDTDSNGQAWAILPVEILVP